VVPREHRTSILIRISTNVCQSTDVYNMKKITNYKSQIPNKFKLPKSQIQNRHVVFGV